ncbi:hypothetical protein GGX14DRAFT_363101, partial [Mycena pura]
LSRSMAIGGGSPSVLVLTVRLFGQDEDGNDRRYADLRQKDKARVDAIQRHERTWENDHQHMCVFSRKCVRTVEPNRDGSLSPCLPCRAVLHSSRFRAILAIEMPQPDNFRYINICFNPRYVRLRLQIWLTEPHFQDPENILLRFIRGVLAGQFDDEKVFFGLLEAMVQSKDREARGVGRQNFQFAPEWDEFVQITSTYVIVHSISP